MLVIETNGAGDPVSTHKATAADQSARSLFLFPMALQTWIVLSVSTRGGLPQALLQKEWSCFHELGSSRLLNQRGVWET